MIRIITLVLAIVMFAPASQAATRGRVRRNDGASTVTLKGVLKPPPTVVRMAPVIKGRKPEAAPAPTPQATPEEAAPVARPRKAQPKTEEAPVETAPAPQPEVAAAPAPAGRIDKALSALIAQPATVETRDKLRAYVASHNKAEQVVPALVRIGGISAALGDFANARSSYESAVKLTSQPTERALAREGLLETLIRQGQLDQAEQVWTALRAESPDHVLSPVTQIDAGMMLAMQGKGNDARRLWDQMERALQTMPQGQADATRVRLVLARGLADELEGHVDQALAVYKDIVSRQPQSEAAATARVRIADIAKPLTAPATTAKP